MKDRFRIIDLIRGYAALGVVLFHYSNHTLRTIIPNDFSDIFQYGKYGVQAFFVISGFVIPYSMTKNKYHIKDFFNTLLRRYLRIAPPAYISIVLMFILYTAPILILGRPLDGIDSWWPGFNFLAIFANFTFTVPFLNTSWYNIVFWTLAIEFQFYIVVGILFPMKLKEKTWHIIITITAILLLGYISFEWFFSYGSFFILGFILFLRKEELFPKNYIYILSIISLLFCFHQNILPAFISGLVTFIVIFIDPNITTKFSDHLGKVSYSLYLTHLPVGNMLEIIIKRIVDINESPFIQLLTLFAYTGLAILFASIFYHYIEKPSINYSKRIKLSNKQ